MDEEDSLVIYRRSLLRGPPAISSKPGELEEEDVHTNMDTFQEHNFYGGGGSFVYATDNFLLLASGGGGGGAPGGYNGVDDQAGSSGTTSGFITTGT